MSHRPEYMSKYSSKGAFAGLAVEDLPSEEEEEEPVIIESVIQPAPPTEAPKPLTKTQQKKAAKASKQHKVPSPVTTKNTLPDSNNPNATTIVETQDSPLGAGPTTPLLQPKALRARSRSPPSSFSISNTAEPPFTPNLPNDLPHPHQKSLVRKRKASTDLTSGAAKESKVEIELGGMNSEGKEEVTIPVTVDVSSSAAPNGHAELQIAKKKADLWSRVTSGLVLAAGFVGLVLAGHIYIIILILVVQSLVYREITQLFQGTRDPWSKTLNWYFFAIANYYFYGETIIYYFKHVMFSEAVFHPFVANHRFISFMLYVFGFMGFVASLKKHYLQRQFSLFGWVHMTLLIVVVSSHFIVDNILEGLIWFWLPASLVIFNDVFAWFWGITLGRTQLFALSPKKTVEGFVGALFTTLFVGVLWATVFMQFDYMICPVRDLGDSAWSGLTCKPNPVFVWREFEIGHAGKILSMLLGRTIKTIPWAPFQFHALIMATFASLVAPFGGFFASGFKRAFNIKDFGQSIPGHGGMTDRMDCQFLMGLWAYVYYSNLIRVNEITVASVLQVIRSGLTRDEQFELLGNLNRLLTG